MRVIAMAALVFVLVAGCGGLNQDPATGDSVESKGTLGGGTIGGNRLAQYGERCGGFVNNPIACDRGLACSHIDANGNFINPDLPGVCLQGAGQPCGGFIATPRVCAAPLHCQLQVNADLGGTCVP
jgi:hypothetical protein